MKKLIFIIFLLFTSMAYGRDYISTAVKVYVTELTVADTWYEVLPASRTTGIRGYKIKARFDGSSAPSAFDYSFTSSPSEIATGAGDGYYSNTGVGMSDEAAPSNGIWARSSTAGTDLEVVTYE